MKASFKKTITFWGMLLFLAFMSSWTSPSCWASAFVNDSGKFFSDSTLKELSSRIEQIKNATGKDIYVITVDRLEKKSIDGATVALSIDEAAVAFGKEKKVNGVVIYVSRVPSKLTVKVGTNTARLITPEKKAMVRNAMVKAFKEKRFDDGILQAVTILEDTMKYKVSSVTSSKPSPVSAYPVSSPPLEERKQHKGTNWLVLLLIIGGGFLIVTMILRAISRSQSPQTQGTGQAPSGMGMGGGGFFNSLLGGLGGALLGNWLFNSFSGQHHNNAASGSMMDSGGGNSNMTDTSSGWQNDDAGSFASSSGDSADWGGGGDFGGGDFGGGGDF